MAGMSYLADDKYDSLFNDGYKYVIDGYFKGVSILGKDYRYPTDNKELRRIVALGHGSLDKLLDYEYTLNNTSWLIGNRYRTYPTYSKILVYIEGHDASGKTSTNSIITPLLEDVGFRVSSNVFRAPKVKTATVIDRYKESTDKLDSPINAVVWERGPAGDWVYGKDESVYNYYIQFEDELVKQGFKIIKLHLYSTKERQAKALGKRFARLTIAKSLLEEQNLSEQQNLYAMNLANTSINDNDINAFKNHELYDNRFKEFVKMTDRGGGLKWDSIDTTRRLDSRYQLLNIFGSRLLRKL